MASNQYKVQRINIYDGEPVTRDTAPELNVRKVQPHGRTVVSFPKWFDISAGAVIYISCNFITFETDTGDLYYLVWPYSPDAKIKAHWDELKNEVAIDYHRNVRHIALYCNDRVTILKSFITGTRVGQKPAVRIWNTSCPGDNTVIGCYNIPRLPRLGSSDELAPKSTEMFDKCVDIPALPVLS